MKTYYANLAKFTFFFPPSIMSAENLPNYSFISNFLIFNFASKINTELNLGTNVCAGDLVYFLRCQFYQI
jgi:hypothetical protein